MTQIKKLRTYILPTNQKAALTAINHVYRQETARNKKRRRKQDRHVKPSKISTNDTRSSFLRPRRN